jgi:hypothetical protein
VSGKIIRAATREIAVARRRAFVRRLSEHPRSIPVIFEGGCSSSLGPRVRITRHLVSDQIVGLRRRNGGTQRRLVGSFGALAFLYCIVLVIASLFAVKGAEAASIEVSRLDNGGSLVVLDGDLELGDIEQFRNKVATLSKATVAFRSEGGSLLAGMRIGMLIRVRGFGTVVPDDAQCASACAVAWLGGNQRFMGVGSKVGFHAAYVVKGKGTAESAPGNAVLGAYLYQLGLSEDAIVYITRAGPASMQWLSTEDASQHGIDVAALPSPDSVQGPKPINPAFNEKLQASPEQRATDFVRALALRWSGPNENALRSLDELYADEVRYHGKLIPRKAVVLDTKRFAERWPERNYTIRPGSISATCVEPSEVCHVRATMDRVLANGATNAKWSDASSFEYRIATSGEALQIVAESTSLDKHLEASGPSNPFKIVGRNLRRLLAQVSRLGQASSKR